MKITLISGAGSGIGLSIAKKFYKNGHNLILLVKNNLQKKKYQKYLMPRKLKYSLEILQIIILLRDYHKK